MRKIALSFLILAWTTNHALAQMDSDPVQAFLGPEGVGSQHPEAPPETAQFGRFVGIWDGYPEARRQDGTWVAIAPATWVWKYSFGGFAVQDLWWQNEDQLPPYLKSLGRPYGITTMRIFDKKSGKWKTAWMANGAGKSPGPDFGVFEGEADGDRMVMSGESVPGFGVQRIVFSEIENDSFLWTSEVSSDDGETWHAMMRVRVKRRQAK